MTPPTLELNSPRLILALVITGVALGIIAIAAIAGVTPASPGTPIAQTCAIIGTLGCLVPAAYVGVKRGGLTQHPPRWFALHVICVLVGCIFIGIHVASGRWFSPPGALLAALFFLILQGCFAYLFLAIRLSALFGRAGHGFINSNPDSDLHRRQSIQRVIDAKRSLLKQLDATANEGTFSPNLSHWLHQPLRSWRYQRLADIEANLVGAQRQAGSLLSMWRRLHMLIALLFVLGVLAHIVVVLFFAGYLADGNDITWWHITAWGSD